MWPTTKSANINVVIYVFSVIDGEAATIHQPNGELQVGEVESVVHKELIATQIVVEGAVEEGWEFALQRKDLGY